MDLARAKQLCRAFPGATVDIKWTNVLAFCAGGKMFALCGAQAHSTRGMSVKLDAERFLELTERPGFRPAPCLARAGGCWSPARTHSTTGKWRPCCSADTASFLQD
ncbi:MmcQ/YjbR family DNA-binding protein [Janthinobacterium sp. UMAB-56]|uniref:MmcQ/YjbR family DNA-binding protein n=1 Tax=Janthinobacterium sp. UMAB-56 TaxID=1365361 RepID=UPI00214BAE22|nr:MmcQ/YjbR family DNA-binding protein [Janthinobacterium sp. UMAB-56]